MLTAQIALVQSTFALVRPIAPAATELFYAQLFRLDPSLRPMFQRDMATQGRMLMAALGGAVNGLAQLESLIPVVRRLGARHAEYGVQAAHYETVGIAVLWMLDQVLAERFTPEVRQAWAQAYDLLAGVMQAGARELVSTEQALVAH